MAAAALMTVGVTAVAEGVGARWSGLAMAFPVMAVVVAAASHRAQGADFTVLLRRSLAQGLWSFVAFCATIAFALRDLGTPAAAFAAAIALAQWATRRARIG